ncbi:MAG: Cupin domain protein [Candidatus Methanofastidiosum methylothiophilum]|jgi:quercetin dioxygenase-like cupin family protein|uniref:Cupin domain protein n=1 Tax=Candidatus Methanofastidiosum methylothiophilum TaxID=1705564 RepID=A0A150ISZ5_9EURY|nr:MAG: Cupin domain protein [Candidatus Methanofastidiosum methylthiophilus]
MFGMKSSNGYVEVSKGIKIKTIVYGQKTLMSEFVMKKGSELINHQHIYEQTGYLVKGRIKLFIEEKGKIMNPGDSWNVESNKSHHAEILEDSIAIEVFEPCREEYIKYINANDIDN